MKAVSNFSERLQEAMGDMTATELANLLGLSKQAISTYVHNKRTPKPPTIKTIASLLNVSPAWLMGYDVDRTVSQEINTQTSFRENFTEIEINLINAAKKLNTDGKEILLDYADMLSKNPKYKIDNM